ncbi:aldolase/citrate lyase family protein [Mycobacterium sp. ITM-2016-00317]|uniref:HpcH/HpaI aldolase/citrate lyase family protein n=1 Tax=Mycobacterium sp. ITM-2016-00317 TaxID=2099694 RepID=UPI00287F6BD7|nr:aldolase/citrate lyase family protein [Mycobacterium sp. ITM-2016-00317]WNG87949.1 aldolase/citrate lyase family protein [Mycobacterium sp. ITM-2016-00317]
MTVLPAETVRAARSLLFVPGSRPERFAKAAAAQPDVVILDLEDAVAPSDKDAARRHVESWLADGNAALVRINAADTRWYEQDLAMVGRLGAATMPAKAERPEHLARLAEVTSGAPVVPLVETAAALAALGPLCAVGAVVRLAFGSIDLANQLGVDPDDREALLTFRSMLVAASAAAGLAAPIDGVTRSFTEPDSVTDDFGYARRLGMGAKLCIHPAQVAAVHAAAAPSAAEVEWAQKVVSAAGDGSAVALDGQMIDVPVVERARRILRIAGAA